MTPHIRIVLLAAASVMTVALATPVSAAFIAYDLTGTWSGSLKCKALVGGVKQKTVATPVMKISQLGLGIGVQLDFGTGTTLYNGLANPATKKPEQKGEAALILCGTDDLLGVDFRDEIGRMTVSTKPGKVKASLKGQSFFSNPSDPLSHHGTCKWKWTRIDAVDPGVLVDCARTTLRLPPAGARHRGGVR